MLTVVMPSRGRERQATEAYEAFSATKTLPDTAMLIVLDEGEEGYEDLPTIHLAHDGGMGNALNAGVRLATRTSPTTMVGFIGDDHRFRTPGWDDQIVKANLVMGGGIVYGNDLIRGQELPSAAFIDARVVGALGWMALPGAIHLYLDDAWRELGQRMGRLRYMPNVVIEHMHPNVGKAELDEGYVRVNAPEMYDHDRKVYEQWMRERIATDAQLALAALR